MDAVALRKEIKTWERSFKEENARDPSIDDIKKHPQIADRYKLYKKLAKQQAAPAPPEIQSFSKLPTTPPRRSVTIPESPTIIPKARATHSAVGPSSNPFSPVKTPRRPPMSPNDAPWGIPNFQPHPNESHLSPRVNFHVDSNEPKPPSRTGRALNKARKRLRGDSVSPSPKKQPRISAPIIDDAATLEEDQSFVDESPVKASTGSKDFVSLFDEDRIPAPDFHENSRKKMTDKFAAHDKVRRKPVFVSQSTASSSGSGKPRPVGRPPLADVVQPSVTRDGSAPLRSTNGSPSRKRASPDESDRSSSSSDPQPEAPATLMPPSPTQDGKSKSQKSSIKDFMKKRKKTSAIEISDEGDGTLDDENVDVVELDPIRKCKIRNRSSSDVDEEHPFVEAYARQDSEGTKELSQSELAHDLEVSLRDGLRDILYISHSQTSEMRERALAESLLKGDSRHPGLSDVWDAGEIDRPEPSGSDAEEDWEGEGTPWEVGEM